MPVRRVIRRITNPSLNQRDSVAVAEPNREPLTGPQPTDLCQRKNAAGWMFCLCPRSAHTRKPETKHASYKTHIGTKEDQINFYPTHNSLYCDNCTGCPSFVEVGETRGKYEYGE